MDSVSVASASSSYRWALFFFGAQRFPLDLKTTNKLGKISNPTEVETRKTYLHPKQPRQPQAVRDRPSYPQDSWTSSVRNPPATGCAGQSLAENGRKSRIADIYLISNPAIQSMAGQAPPPAVQRDKPPARV